MAERNPLIEGSIQAQANIGGELNIAKALVQAGRQDEPQSELDRYLARWLPEEEYQKLQQSRSMAAGEIGSFNDWVNDLIAKDYIKSFKEQAQNVPLYAQGVEEGYQQMLSQPVISQTAKQMGQSEYQQAVAKAMAQRGVSGNIPDYYGEYVAQQRPAEIRMEAGLRGKTGELGQNLYATVQSAMRQRIINEITTSDFYREARERVANLLMDKYAIDKGVANQIADQRLRYEIGRSEMLNQSVAQLTQSVFQPLMLYGSQQYMQNAMATALANQFANEVVMNQMISGEIPSFLTPVIGGLGG